MDYKNTVDLLRDLGGNGQSLRRVRFVTPVLSVCLAGAFSDGRIASERIDFAEDAMGYAENNCLRHLLKQSTDKPKPGPAVGRTYCQLSTLVYAEEVHTCNRTIGRLLSQQLEGCRNANLIKATIGVVGELHDNVTSHSLGRGFSAAQVYRGHRKNISIAIADVGCGFGGSIRRAGLDLDDEKAIKWCLVRGNTRVKLPKHHKPGLDHDIWPQRLPDDCLISPYPPDVPTTSKDSHHMGEGLFRLTELIRSTGGSVWIWSGNSQILCGRDAPVTIPCDVEWKGTVIEIEIPIDAFQQSPPAKDREAFKEIARKLGI